MSNLYRSVLTRPSQLKVVFHDSDRHFKATNNDSGYLMSQLLGQCVGLISPPKWRKVKVATEGPLRRNAVNLRVRAVQGHVTSHFSRLSTAPNLTNGVIHPVHDLKALPFLVVCELFYGKLPNVFLERMTQLAAPREQLMKYIIGGGLSRFALSKWLPTEANRALFQFKRDWRQLNRDIVEYCQEHEPESPFLAMWNHVERGEISEDQCLQTLDECLFANLDVTTGGLSWNLVYLAENSDAQQRLRAEAEQANISVSSMEKYLQSPSTFLHCCILESSRLKPLVAFSSPQSAPTGRLIDGFVIPANTNFVVDTYALNIKNEYWAPDNSTYRPDRFMDPAYSDIRYLFWRFGFGPRQYVKQSRI